MKQFTVRDLTLCALFAALLSASAFMKIPTPIVPLTLQFFVVLLTGLLLGAKRGAIAAALYAVMGLCGLPVFASGSGPSYVLQPGFGYILGFIAAAAVLGAMTERKENRTYPRLFLATLAGLAVVYFFGVVYYVLISTFYLKNPLDARALIVSFMLMPLPGDLIKCAAAALVAKRLIPVLRPEGKPV